MSDHQDAGAMPADHDAIRVRVDAGEPAALVFNDRAQPGALVSWAWCQLSALDALLRALLERGSSDDGEVDVVGAVRCVLVPAINALAFSERRAHELRREREAPARRRAGRKKRAARA